MRRHLIILYICALCMAACVKPKTVENEAGEDVAAEESVSEEQCEPVYEYGILLDDYVRVDGTVKNGETLGGLLTRLGAKQQVVNGLGQLPRDAFDTRKFRAGVDYSAYYTREDSVLSYFVYKKDKVESVVFSVQDSLYVERQVKEIRREVRTGAVGIRSSLWNAMERENLPVQLALDLSDIYQWTIDFFGLQVGDSIRLCYEELFVDEASIGVGTIYAANFYHGQKWHEAYYYNSETMAADLSASEFCKGYYAADGTNLRKAFLKAPLNYKRISSTFTYHRKHPIYGTVRPHTGVDYAAPMGTPVVTIGDGVVTEKGFKGGGGNTVKIKHNSVYSTAYLHLSKYGPGIAVGKRVAQGDVIGYVGSTGSSTGPHLDFRVWKNGTPVDPLHMDAPAADPVPEVFAASFKQVVDTYQNKVK